MHKSFKKFKVHILLYYLTFVVFFASFIFFIFFPIAIFAKDITSPSFIVRDPVIGTIGGYGYSPSFQLFSSGDKVLIGVGASATFLGHYGFLYFEGGTSLPPAPTPTPTPSGSTRRSSSGTVGPFCKIADFNCDGLVNISDLSILLFYYNQTGLAVSHYDLNGDGQINLPDISIMFYYWSP